MTIVIRILVGVLWFMLVASAAAQHENNFSVAGYYSPIIDHRHFWRHGISFAGEYKYGNYSVGPRYTLARVDGGKWYGNEHLIGAHLSRHFKYRFFEPHAHVELGYSWTKYPFLRTHESGAYYGLGGSLGWHVGCVTFQVPQYTHLEFYTGPHRRQESFSAGISVRL